MQGSSAPGARPDSCQASRHLHHRDGGTQLRPRQSPLPGDLGPPRRAACYLPSTAASRSPHGTTLRPEPARWACAQHVRRVSDPRKENIIVAGTNMSREQNLAAQALGRQGEPQPLLGVRPIAEGLGSLRDLRLCRCHRRVHRLHVRVPSFVTNTYGQVKSFVKCQKKRVCFCFCSKGRG